MPIKQDGRLARKFFKLTARELGLQDDSPALIKAN
jgi:hypothetical protein